MTAVQTMNEQRHNSDMIIMSDSLDTREAGKVIALCTDVLKKPGGVHRE